MFRRECLEGLSNLRGNSKMMIIPNNLSKHQTALNHFIFQILDVIRRVDRNLRRDCIFYFLDPLQLEFQCPQLGSPSHWYPFTLLLGFVPLERHKWTIHLTVSQMNKNQYPYVMWNPLNTSIHSYFDPFITWFIFLTCQSSLPKPKIFLAFKITPQKNSKDFSCSFA